MIHIGMIFQYDATQGEGLIMFSDTKKREFGPHNWVDNQAPVIGQKVACAHVENSTHIKAADKDDQITVSPDWVDGVLQEDEKNEVLRFSTIEEYILYFTEMGFKLVKDVTENDTREVTLRIYTPEDYGEVTLKQDGSKISVKQVMNGKTVLDI